MARAARLAAPSRPDWVRTAVDRCQIDAGRQHSPDEDCVEAGRSLLARLPPPGTLVESLILRGMLAEVMLRRAVDLRSAPPQCITLLKASLVSAHPKGAKRIGRVEHPRVSYALGIITQRFSNPNLHLRDVAAAAGVSPSHLSRVMRRETGTDFLTHVRDVRLQTAAGLLRTGKLSIKEVAGAVGYKYPGDFARHFKQRYGAAPNAWRLRAEA